MRLIDADAITTDFVVTNEATNAIRLYISYEQLKNAPTIDPVKHGRWIYYEDETIEDGGRCSVCQCDQPVFLEDWKWEFVETAYCPNCGAKMDEEG